MYGEEIEMEEDIKKLRNNLSNSIWLTVISQIMTRLGSKTKKTPGISMSPFIREIKELLLKLTRSDFHSMIFPLLFSNNSKNEKNSLKKHVLIEGAQEGCFNAWPLAITPDRNRN